MSVTHSPSAAVRYKRSNPGVGCAVALALRIDTPINAAYLSAGAIRPYLLAQRLAES